MIDAARREALGRVPNPFSVSSSHSYKVFDYLVQRDELVLLEEIRKAVPIGYGSYQIDTALNPRTLKAAGWKLRKGKVNGKVAYMLEEVPEDERA
jgi:hypothetical protein